MKIARRTLDKPTRGGVGGPIEILLDGEVAGDFWNVAYAGAFARGAQACVEGKPRVHPYADHRTHRNGVTFSRAFARYWVHGWDAANARLGEPA